MSDSERASKDEHAERVLTDLPQLNGALQVLFNKAERTIVVRAVRLELRYFRSAAMRAQVERLVAANSHSRLKLLVEDPSHFLRHNTRLIELCRRFSSFIEVREAVAEYAGDKDLFVVVDQVAFMHQPRIDIPRAVTGSRAPAESRKLERRFDDGWQHAEPLAGIFSLGL